MKFCIDINKASNAAAGFEKAGGVIVKIGSYVFDIANSSITYGDSSTTDTINKAIRRSAEFINNIGNSSNGCADTIGKAAILYSNTDSKIAGTAIDANSFLKNRGDPFIAGGTENKTGNNEKSEKSFWEKLRDGDFKGEKTSAKGTFKRGSIDGAAKWKELSWSIKGKVASEWDAKKGKMTTYAGVEGKGELLGGEAELNAGPIRHKVSGSVGKIEGKGEVGISLLSYNRLEPGIYGKISGKITGLHGEYESRAGNEDFNIHNKAEGDLGVIKGELEAHAGYYTYKDAKSGEERTGFGVGASVGGEAYAAEGKVSGGITLFGIKIDGSISGKAGGGGAKIGGSVGTESVEGEVGLGLLVGLGFKIKIDYSGFRWPWGK